MPKECCCRVSSYPGTSYRHNDHFKFVGFVCCIQCLNIGNTPHDVACNLDPMHFYKPAERCFQPHSLNAYTPWLLHCDQPFLWIGVATLDWVANQFTMPVGGRGRGVTHRPVRGRCYECLVQQEAHFQVSDTCQAARHTERLALLSRTVLQELQGHGQQYPPHPPASLPRQQPPRCPAGPVSYTG